MWPNAIGSKRVSENLNFGKLLLFIRQRYLQCTNIKKGSSRTDSLRIKDVRSQNGVSIAGVISIYQEKLSIPFVGLIVATIEVEGSKLRILARR